MRFSSFFLFWNEIMHSFPPLLHGTTKFQLSSECTQCSNQTVTAIETYLGLFRYLLSWVQLVLDQSHFHLFQNASSYYSGFQITIPLFRIRKKYLLLSGKIQCFCFALHPYNFNTQSIHHFTSMSFDDDDPLQPSTICCATHNITFNSPIKFDNGYSLVGIGATNHHIQIHSYLPYYLWIIYLAHKWEKCLIFSCRMNMR